MPRTNLYGLFAVLAVSMNTIACAAEDPCAAQIYDNGAHVTLKSAQPVDGKFVGEFEIENRTATTLSIPANFKNGTFALRKPELWVEYRDLGNSWAPIPDAPRDNLNVDKLRIAPRRTATFSAVLMTQKLANLQASDFRVVIRLFDQGLCIVSAPFRTLPIREKAVGLLTVSPLRQD